MAAPMAMENLASAGEGRREVAAKASLDEEQKDKKGAGGEGAMVEPTVRVASLLKLQMRLHDIPTSTGGA